MMERKNADSIDVSGFDRKKCCSEFRLCKFGNFQDTDLELDPPKALQNADFPERCNTEEQVGLRLLNRSEGCLRQLSRFKRRPQKCMRIQKVLH